MNRRLPMFCLIICALLACGCANVLFERGPYAIRGLEVVYSAQEDVTFLSWRLREDAQLSRVTFELWEGDGYVPIELGEAPFAAEPYACGGHWCFQYQVDGEYSLPPESSPLRSVHEDEGVFMGPAERFRRVQTTFSIDPIALGHNDRIDPNRTDWFDENDVDLRRDYEWQFTAWNGPGCEEPRDGVWSRVDAPIPVMHSWTDRATADAGICFALRPIRSDERSVHVQEYMVPSAETTFASQRYLPPKVEAPIVWGLVLDLEIASDARCRQVKSSVIGLLENSINARGTNRKLGVYTPLDPETGEELGGCDQAAVREYPFETMLRDAQRARAAEAPRDVRVLWVFVNNIELPPPARVVEQLEWFALAALLGEGAEELPELPDDEEFPIDEDLLALGTTSYTWAIGSNVFMGVFPWDMSIPWRPVEDETLAADLKSAAKTALPFTTMLHSRDTEVAIELPRELESRPLHFKICDATPFPIDAIGSSGGIYSPRDRVPWPEFDDPPPYYLVSIPEQVLVPSRSYVRRGEEIVVEFCTAFCDGPFRNRGGMDHDSWFRTSECRWER